MTKKIVSLVLAVIMLLGCLSVTAFADEVASSTNQSGSTTITAKKILASGSDVDVPSVSYVAVIPAGITLERSTKDNWEPIGTPTVINVTGTNQNTKISYTVSTTQLTNVEDDSKIMKTSYRMIPNDNVRNASVYAEPLKDNITVFTNGSVVAHPFVMLVQVKEEDWYNAPAGTYTATMTFNFTVEGGCQKNFNNVATLRIGSIYENGTVDIKVYNSQGGTFKGGYYSNIPLTALSSRFGIAEEDYHTGNVFHATSTSSKTWEKCTSPSSHAEEFAEHDSVLTFLKESFAT